MANSGVAPSIPLNRQMTKRTHSPPPKMARKKLKSKKRPAIVSSAISQAVKKRLK